MAASVPPNLKPIQPFLKIASDYDKRDAIVAYYCRMYAVQKGIKLDNKSHESKSHLFNLMDQLEKSKQDLTQEEAIKNDIVAQAHIEDKAVKLFVWADTEDRAARFGKNVVKAFYTASLIFEILTMFGELSEEASKQQKYAKWKAAYIIKCQKAGQTPIPGPQEGSGDGECGDDSPSQVPGSTSEGDSGLPYPSTSQSQIPQMPSFPQAHQPLPPIQPEASHIPDDVSTPSTSSGLSPSEIEKAQKMCRYAISALQYDDISTAVDNLEKALALLRTGQ